MDFTEIKAYRDEGMQWSDIGDLFGMSGEAIRSKYKRWRKKNKQMQGNTSTNEASITGVIPDDYDGDVEKLWGRVIDAQGAHENFIARKSAQTIKLDPPFAIAVLSDLHFGNQHTDYRAIRNDAMIIKETDGMYAGFHGDGVDNFIIGKLNALERNQDMTLDSEWQLFESWLEMLAGKLLYVVSGNHDNWTIKTSGFDRVRNALKGTLLLYDTDEVIFDLDTGVKTWRVKVRHKWKGNSIFNPTHGIEVSWQRGGHNFDIGIGGHTHIDTVCRPFLRHGKRMYAILTGTYKRYDSYAREIGFAPTHGRGSGCMVFDAKGNMQFFEDLESGARYLEYLQSLAQPRVAKSDESH